MIKIGDKVKFDEYLPHNYMTNQALRVTLSGSRKLTNRKMSTQRLENMTRYRCILVNEITPLEGIFVGTFRKKLVRNYRRTQPTVRPDVFDTTEVEVEEDNPFGMLRRRRVRPITQEWEEEMGRRDRYSHNPRRMDDPRSLNKMAMIKIGRRLIASPMTNVLKCNFGNVLRVL
jgi:hypothetical protein